MYVRSNSNVRAEDLQRILSSSSYPEDPLGWIGVFRRHRQVLFFHHHSNPLDLLVAVSIELISTVTLKMQALWLCWSIYGIRHVIIN